jgi:hypothetical protein
MFSDIRFDNQKSTDLWMNYFDNERPHRGYRNIGRRLPETVEDGKSIKKITETEAVLDINLGGTLTVRKVPE